MNKYQKTIYNLVHLNKARGEVFIDHKQLQQDIDILWELYNKYDELTKTPTLEEVKKEWEALGYEWVENEIYINIIKEYEGIDFDVILSIDKRTRNYCCFEDDGCDNRSLSITYQEHQLLTKTFRALGWCE